MSQAGMKEDAGISQLGQWPCVHSPAASDSLGNHFSLTFHSHEPVSSPYLLRQ